MRGNVSPAASAGEWFAQKDTTKGDLGLSTSTFTDMSLTNPSLFLIWNKIGIWGPPWVT